MKVELAQGTLFTFQGFDRYIPTYKTHVGYFEDLMGYITGDNIVFCLGTIIEKCDDDEDPHAHDLLIWHHVIAGDIIGWVTFRSCDVNII
jgi:hypothetical protein